MSVSWSALLDAAERKVAIAEFHAFCLEAALAEHPGTDPESASETPAVPVQAHFEGSIIAVISAVDQVAQAINSARGLGLEPSQLVDGAFTELMGQVEGLKEWFNNPLGRDLRSVRRLMIHYAYDKKPGGLSWVVADATRSGGRRGSATPYSGPRELFPYARDAAAYGRKLLEALPGIRRALEG